MYKGKKHIGIRILFLAIFFSYFAGISFFNHTHVVNGITIVHSHFYSGSTNTNKNAPGHTHPNNVLNLIAQAACWMTTLHQTPEIPKIQLTRIVLRPVEHLLITGQTAPTNFYLRGPPAKA